MKKIIIALLITLVFLVGCYRTIYVPHGQAVQLRESIEKAKVWVMTDEGEKIPGKMTLQEGWYCLSMDEEEPNGDE